MEDDETLLGEVYSDNWIDDNIPSNIFSSDLTQVWKASPYYKSILIDLKKTKYISNLNIIFGDNGAFYHFYVEFSNDHINWDTLVDKQDETVNDDQGFSFNILKDYRYIKITISYSSIGMNVEIKHLQINGHESQEICDDSGTKKRIINCSNYSGFELMKDYDIEPEFNWKDDILISDKPGSYISIHDVDFKDGQFDQLRMLVGLPFKSKTHYLDFEFRLDRLDGELIGTIHMSRQYKPWCEIAFEIKHQNGKNIEGIHSVVIVLKTIDEPQQIGFLYYELASHPMLSDANLDFINDLDNEGKYHVYYGDAHSHTSFSDGMGTPEFAYDYARNVAKLDFLGITEHSNCLDQMFDVNKCRRFKDLQKAAEKKNEDGKFVALYGSEITWYNQLGHMNIYCADFFINSYEFKYDSIHEYYQKLKQYPYIISQWNHPWSCGERHLELATYPYDKALDDITHTLEMNDIEKPEDEVLKYYIIALDNGWHVSPVGNQDNHKIDWGTQNGIRTGVIAKHLTRGDLYDAAKHQRTYFMGAPNIRVIYRLNGMIQGSRIKEPECLEISVDASVDDGHKLVRIDVYGRNSQIVKVVHLDSQTANMSFNVDKGSDYYFLKVVRDDNKYAVTGPVWIEKDH